VTDPTGTADEPVALSAVVITENEEDNVEDCIESVIAAARRAVSSFEVILVDSASSDRTVELASDYPVTIRRIPAEHVVSCGAGRYVGEAVASGEFLLHVDGDMELTETWLAEAVAYLRANDDVAAVEGCLNTDAQTEVQDVRSVGGVMLFDADVLASVGGFDPNLRGYEDIDVAFRLSQAGYRLVCLPSVSATHEWDTSLAEPLRRWRAGYYAAPGQVMRKAAPDLEILRKLLVLQKYKLGLFAWLLVGVGSLRSRQTTIGWLGLSLAGFGALARTRGTHRMLRYVVIKLFGLAGLVVGLTEPPDSPAAYPLETVEDVKTGAVLEGQPRPIEQ
jgi:GT2 family glycosyltransferase